MTNFMIPDHFGLGKSVARGFGTVKGLKGFCIVCKIEELC